MVAVSWSYCAPRTGADFDQRSANSSGVTNPVLGGRGGASGNYNNGGDGYEFARLIHFALTMGYIGFFVIHVGQVILAGWNNFRSMVIGYELVKDGEPQ